MQKFYHIFKQLKTEEEFLDFINISLTEKEQEMLIERWKILEELNKGQSQRKVASEVGCSVVTVTRGAKVYRKKTEVIQNFLKLFNQNKNK